MAPTGLCPNRARTAFAKQAAMTDWQKPHFEELAMNAEIGAYQPEFGDDERSDEPFVNAELPPVLAVPARVVEHVG
jgi:hypothetical protein